MLTKLRRRAKHRIAALLLVATAAVGAVLVYPEPTHAVITFPAPPTCHRDIRPIQWKTGAYAFYEFAYEYRGRRLGPADRGMYRYERIYVYHVQNMIFPYGLVSAGRAEKVCGTIIAR